MEIQTLPAYLIASPSLARPVDKRKAGEIAESIREIGLLSPIIVAPGTRVRNGTPTPGWDILAGNHRFEAMFRVLNWKEIPCVVTDADGLKAELLTIDENLVRRELSDAERAYQTGRRKEIYESLHPETKHGASPGASGGGKRKSESRQIGDFGADRFTASTASATGRSERAVQREARRGEKLGPTLNRIVGTSLDRGVEIDALVTLPVEQREDLVSRAERGERVSARVPDPADRSIDSKVGLMPEQALASERIKLEKAPKPLSDRQSREQLIDAGVSEVIDAMRDGLGPRFVEVATMLCQVDHNRLRERLSAVLREDV